MATASEYLEQALTLGQEELLALRNGDVDTATDIADRRGHLTSLAWSAPNTNPQTFKEALLRLQALQTTLSTEAIRLKESIRAGLVHSRMESRRMAGYRQAVSHAL